MVKTEVSAEDRFARLLRDEESDRWMPGQPTEGAKVDLLCDPVTLRYASESREPVGSPADGRHLLADRLPSAASPTWNAAREAAAFPVLGFVANTTARKVVLQACERDAFRERPKAPERSPNRTPSTRCEEELEEGERKFNRGPGLPAALLKGKGLPEPRCGRPRVHRPARSRGASGFHEGLYPDTASACSRNYASAAQWFCAAQPGRGRALLRRQGLDPRLRGDARKDGEVRRQSTPTFPSTAMSPTLC